MRNKSHGTLPRFDPCGFCVTARGLDVHFGRAGLVTLLGVAFAALCASCTPEPSCADAGGCSDAGPPALPIPAPSRAPVEADAACAMQSARAERGPAKQVDIVFVIDNSSSMSEEIAAIRTNINQNFATLIRQSGVDFRVVLLSLYGTGGTSICIDPPLAGAPCSDGLYSTNSDVFFHYNLEVASGDALCLLLYAFDHPDPEQRAPRGFQAWLRPDAEKVFVVISDDSASCQYRDGKDAVEFNANGADPYDDALLFHRTLLSLAPEQFGKPPRPPYRFYSIVGLAKAAASGEAWFPDQPLNSKTCETAPSAGLSYQAISILTDALRYPVCEGRSFDAVFRVLARDVIEASKVACVFQLPRAPDEQAIDIASVRVEYRAEGQEPNLLGQIPDAARCNARSFYLRDDRIELCPQACEAVQTDPSTEINVLYGCNEIPL